jgi:hypothetical protein
MTEVGTTVVEVTTVVNVRVVVVGIKVNLSVHTAGEQHSRIPHLGHASSSWALPAAMVNMRDAAIQICAIFMIDDTNIARATVRRKFYFDVGYRAVLQGNSVWTFGTRKRGVVEEYPTGLA